MHGRGHRLVLEVFTWVYVVKGRLEESPQESGHTENDAANSHRFSFKDKAREQER